MKYIILFAAIEAIKINDKESKPIPMANLAQNDPEIEDSLAQLGEQTVADLDAQADEQFKFFQSGKIASTSYLSMDLLSIGTCMGIAEGTTTWGSLDYNNDIFTFFTELWT